VQTGRADTSGYPHDRRSTLDYLSPSHSEQWCLEQPNSVPRKSELNACYKVGARVLSLLPALAAKQVCSFVRAGHLR
jgi:hypothetical protein